MYKVKTPYGGIKVYSMEKLFDLWPIKMTCQKKVHFVTSKAKAKNNFTIDFYL